MIDVAESTRILRRKVKGALESSLLRTGIPKAVYHFHSSKGLILAYHNIVPDGSPPFGDVPLHLSRSRFARHLDHLEETHQIVPLAKFLDRVESGDQIDRPVAALTFDDAYLGAVTLGVEEVTSRGLPATIFVVPSMIGSASFWWDALARPSGGGLSPDVRKWAIRECGGDTVQIRDAATVKGLAWNSVPEWAGATDRHHLRRAVEFPEISVGSHGWGHLALSEQSGYRVKAEVERARRWLREEFPDSWIDWFAYPYGLTSAGARRAIRLAGYRAAVRVDGGWCDPGTLHRHSLSRLSVSAKVTDAGFRLRLAGLFC